MWELCNATPTYPPFHRPIACKPNRKEARQERLFFPFFLFFVWEPYAKIKKEKTERAFPWKLRFLVGDACFLGTILGKRRKKGKCALAEH
jgi:hypothetical protein